MDPGLGQTPRLRLLKSSPAQRTMKRVAPVSTASRVSTAQKRKTNCCESHRITTSIKACAILRVSISAVRTHESSQSLRLSADHQLLLVNRNDGRRRNTHSSLCNLCVLCVSVVVFPSNSEPQRHRAHRGCTEEESLRLGGSSSSPTLHHQRLTRTNKTPCRNQMRWTALRFS